MKMFGCFGRRFKRRWCRSVYLLFMAVFGIIVIFYYLPLFHNPSQPDTISTHDDDDSLETVLLDDKFPAEMLYRIHRYNNRNKLNLKSPGELGEGVYLNATGKQLEHEKETVEKEAFNLVVSDLIALNRTLRDYRHPLCKKVKYNVTALPKASVIIVFTNEPWSTLLRTVHSVVNRSPPHLLQEVILVDDFSDRPEVSRNEDNPDDDRLRKYTSDEWPDGLVSLHRLENRSGLIRARLKGAEVAVGSVILFLDAHCEVTEGWLEPLLQRLVERPNSFVCPIIDSVDSKTFYYNGKGTADSHMGGFWWTLLFSWKQLPIREMIRRKSPIEVIQSPTMAGGLFAVRRQFFFEIGSYDDAMEIWGGENMELSFRAWLCGSAIELIPCSRVGHVFRNFHPYGNPGNKDTHGINSVRLAEVWLDDYKRLFYYQRPDLKNVEYGDISKRKELRKRLRCKPFKYFLDNIFPEKFVLDENSIAWGYAMNDVEGRRMCLDTLGQDEKFPFTLGLYYCHPGSNNQIFALSSSGELRREESCAEPTIDDETQNLPRQKTVTLAECVRVYNDDDSRRRAANLKHQTWHFDVISGAIRNMDTNLCLSSRGIFIGEHILLAECDPQDTNQIFVWEHVRKTA